MNRTPDQAPPSPWTRNYQPGVRPEIDLPTTSLVEMCEQAVREAGDAVALQFFGRTTSYAQLGEQIARAAAGLRRLGVMPGDRVALILPNCPQHVVAFYAVLRLGATVVEHNPLYTSRELRQMFADHGARVVIAWDAAVSKLREHPGETEFDHVVSVNLLREFPLVKRLALRLPVPKLRATRDRLSQPAPGTTPWEELLRNKPIDTTHPRPAVDDVAVIQYTSGTTGGAKGAVLTHYNLYANALQGAEWMKDADTGRETIYAVLPMFHAFGMTLYLTFGVLKQARIVLFPTFDADLVLDAARRNPPTVYCAVPPIYEKTARRAIQRNVDLRSAKFCISGAMNLTDEIVELWEGVAGGLLVEGYGLTEAAPVALGNPFHPTRRTGTIGVPFPSTKMLVVDPDDPTREVAQGEEGELLIKGPQVFQGYWNNQEETEKSLLPGGWLRTGDLVTVDTDGFTTIVDRVKELIITGGFNVSPTEVEIVLRGHEDVEDAAVVGVPLPSGGEKVVAAVVLKPGRGLDSESLRAYCKERLAAYKAPRVFTALDELPRSMLGKILRREVREALVGNQTP
ncbi:AMP-binding protein [Tessaracoccus sp. OS52]|uniref:long-chain-fatty-acid--CoA ligase n=1 Tax=Tessaracoccus sp. OS52 TaxID=2886691 RepID=UPI001D116FC1|nr:AMP-binding protein [Tessaracoccus sp. OS52]